MEKILIIDDSIGILTTLENFFKKQGYSVQISESGQNALQLFKTENFDVVICDLFLPDINGTELIVELQKINPLIVVIVMTGYQEADVISRALRNGALEVILKPFTPQVLLYLLAKIESIFKNRAEKLTFKYLINDQREVVIPNDFALIPAVSNYIFAETSHLIKEDHLLRVGLQEILINAIEHGNLEVDDQLKSELLSRGYYLNELRERATTSKYRDRVVRIRYFATSSFLRIEVEDMGNGFDVSFRSTNRDEDFDSEHGRGIKIACLAYDAVIYNEKGNRVNLIKFSEFVPEAEKNLQLFLGLAKKKSEQNETIPSSLKEYSLWFKKNFSGKEVVLPENYKFFFLQHNVNDFPDHYVFSIKHRQKTLLCVSGISCANLIATNLFTICRELFEEYFLSGLELDEILCRINKIASGLLPVNVYLKILLIEFDAEHYQIKCLNAGFPEILIFDRKNSEPVDGLRGYNLFCGINDGQKFKHQVKVLKDYLYLLIYNDQLVEQQSPDGRRYGLERVWRILKDDKTNDPQQVGRELLENLLTFTQGNVQSDLILLLIKPVRLRP